jgi:hypothetical protein
MRKSRRESSSKSGVAVDSCDKIQRIVLRSRLCRRALGSRETGFFQWEMSIPCVADRAHLLTSVDLQGTKQGVPALSNRPSHIQPQPGATHTNHNTEGTEPYEFL